MTKSTGVGRGGWRPGAGRPRRVLPPVKPVAVADSEGGDLMAAGRELAARILKGLIARNALPAEIAQYVKTLFGLASACRALETDLQAAAATSTGKKAAATARAYHLASSDRYATPAPPLRPAGQEDPLDALDGKPPG